MTNTKKPSLTERSGLSGHSLVPAAALLLEQFDTTRNPEGGAAIIHPIGIFHSPHTPEEYEQYAALVAQGIQHMAEYLRPESPDTILLQAIMPSAQQGLPWQQSNGEVSLAFRPARLALEMHPRGIDIETTLLSDTYDEKLINQKLQEIANEEAQILGIPNLNWEQFIYLKAAEECHHAYQFEMIMRLYFVLQGNELNDAQGWQHFLEMAHESVRNITAQKAIHECKTLLQNIDDGALAQHIESLGFTTENATMLAYFITHADAFGMHRNPIEYRDNHPMEVHNRDRLTQFIADGGLDNIQRI